MPPKRRRVKRRKKNRHLILVLFLIVVGVFFYFEEFQKEKAPEQAAVITKPYKKPKSIIPEIPASSTLPRVAIIIDDLGSSKQKALEIFNIDSPITISILPRLKYSAWTAEEANRRGHDIILHISMEATRPMKLGKGGLYTWMTDEEINSTLNDNINSVPYIKGASNHMGSAFTQDKRAMKTVLSELKKQDFFFHDSITGPKSIAYSLAKTMGLRTYRRDVFLDDKDDPVEIEKQWNRLLAIAEKQGHAIAQGHPRKNTLDFLRKMLRSNDKVVIVPITELTAAN